MESTSYLLIQDARQGEPRRYIDRQCVYSFWQQPMDSGMRTRMINKMESETESFCAKRRRTGLRY